MNFTFPDDIFGWLTRNEGTELARLAEDLVVLEIGCCAGRSTCCLAQTAEIVHVVDVFDPIGMKEYLPSHLHDYEAVFYNNVIERGIFDKLVIHKGSSVDVLPTFEDEVSMVFIDGNHHPYAAAHDILWAKLQRPVLIAVHDYGEHSWPGVKQAFDYILGNPDYVVDHLAVKALW